MRDRGGSRDEGEEGDRRTNRSQTRTIRMTINKGKVSWHKGGFSNFGDGVIEWGDLLLDGWEPLAAGP